MSDSPLSAQFDLPRLEKLLGTLSQQELDGLPFGTILLDAHGVVRRYNATESRFSGHAPDQVLHKRFFDEIAPCTNTPEFFGQYQSILGNTLEESRFEYVLKFKSGLTRVFVRLLRASEPGFVWLVIALRSRDGQLERER